MRQYYEQRADPATGAGLIITEATQISPMGQGYLDTPGLHSAEQVAGWKRISDAVPARGGRIVVQLWHVGRISHRSRLPGGQPPVSSTARAANVNTLTPAGRAPCSTPRALRTDEIPGVVADYRQAALNAIEAGFDGVEVHGANGYLLDPFLRDSINDRSDAYGGSIENRARLLLEVMAAVAGAMGGDRTGLRLSPVTPSNDAAPDSDPQALMEHVVARPAPLKLAFLHVVEGQTGGARDFAPFDCAALRRLYGAAGTLLMIGASGLFAWASASAVGCKRPPCCWARRRGGIAEMSITAKVLQLGVPVVTVFQLVRCAAVLTLTAPLYRFEQRRLARRPGGA